MSPLWLFRVPSVCLLGLGFALMALVTPGPFPIGSVTLDVHTMLLGSLCVLGALVVLYVDGAISVHDESGFAEVGTPEVVAVALAMVLPGERRRFSRRRSRC